MEQCSNPLIACLLTCVGSKLVGSQAPANVVGTKLQDVSLSLFQGPATCRCLIDRALFVCKSGVQRSHQRNVQWTCHVCIRKPTIEIPARVMPHSVMPDTSASAGETAITICAVPHCLIRCVPPPPRSVMPDVGLRAVEHLAKFVSTCVSVSCSLPSLGYPSTNRWRRTKYLTRWRRLIQEENVGRETVLGDYVDAKGLSARPRDMYSVRAASAQSLVSCFCLCGSPSEFLSLLVAQNSLPPECIVLEVLLWAGGGDKALMAVGVAGFPGWSFRKLWRGPVIIGEWWLWHLPCCWGGQCRIFL